MSSLAKISSSQRNGVMATAQECVNRIQVFRTNIIEKPSKSSRDYLENMLNFYDYLEYLLIQNFLPGQQMEECENPDNDILFFNETMNQLMFLRNNEYERLIYKTLLKMFIKNQKANGRKDVAKKMKRVGKERMEASRMVEKRNAKKGAEKKTTILGRVGQLLVESLCDDLCVCIMSALDCDDVLDCDD